MDGHAKLSPNWLAEDLAEAASDLALAKSPQRVRSTPGLRGVPDQFGADDARRLRKKMAARYTEWTGRDLGADLRAE